MYFHRESDTKNFTAIARSNESIFLSYRDAAQSAVLTREDAIWLAGAITDWAGNSGHFDFYVRAANASFGLIAEDDTQGFIWYERQQQGAYLPRVDMLWLRSAILEWLSGGHSND